MSRVVDGSTQVLSRMPLAAAQSVAPTITKRRSIRSETRPSGHCATAPASVAPAMK